MKAYLCIDLKTFFASVECVERKLDPFAVNLVVADPSRGKGALCLAVSPKMKEQGFITGAEFLKYRIISPISLPCRE